MSTCARHLAFLRAHVTPWNVLRRGALGTPGSALSAGSPMRAASARRMDSAMRLRAARRPRPCGMHSLHRY